MTQYTCCHTLQVHFCKLTEYRKIYHIYIYIQYIIVFECLSDWAHDNIDYFELQTKYLWSTLLVLNLCSEILCSKCKCNSASIGLKIFTQIGCSYLTVGYINSNEYSMTPFYKILSQFWHPTNTPTPPQQYICMWKIAYCIKSAHWCCSCSPLVNLALDQGPSQVWSGKNGNDPAVFNWYYQLFHIEELFCACKLQSVHALFLNSAQITGLMAILYMHRWFGSFLKFTLK